jgi:hypothetical protein
MVVYLLNKGSHPPPPPQKKKKKNSFYKTASSIKLTPTKCVAPPPFLPSLTFIFIAASCVEGSVRIQGGSSTQGRVEICHSNHWGTVCDSSWDDIDARIVCVQLGQPSSSNYTNLDSNTLQPFKTAFCLQQLANQLSYSCLSES